MADCANHGCRAPAVVIVHWPGKSTPMCREHSDKAQRLGLALGFIVAAEVIPPDDSEPHTAKDPTR